MLFTQGNGKRLERGNLCKTPENEKHIRKTAGNVFLRSHLPKKVTEDTAREEASIKQKTSFL